MTYKNYHFIKANKRFLQISFSFISVLNVICLIQYLSSTTDTVLFQNGCSVLQWSSKLAKSCTRNKKDMEAPSLVAEGKRDEYARNTIFLVETYSTLGFELYYRRKFLLVMMSSCLFLLVSRNYWCISINFQCIRYKILNNSRCTDN